MTQVELDDEALDTRGRNITLAVFGAIVALIAFFVIQNYLTKRGHIAAMKSYEPARRIAAARAMMARGDVAEQLQGERPSVRMVAVRALRAVGNADAAKKLIPFLKDTDHPIKELTIQSLIALGPEVALEAAVTALGDSSEDVKKGAERVCTAFEAVAIDPLLAKLSTASRRNAANALFEISKKSEALRQRIIAGTLPYLDETKYDEDTQNNAIDLLDRTRAQPAVAALIRKLERNATRRAAVGALGRIGDPQATWPLLRLLPVDETLRVEIVLALGRIGDPEAIPALIAHGLGGLSEAVRNAAADALRGMGAAAVPALIATLRDPDPNRRAGAAQALGGMRGEPQAIAAAVRALSDPHERVREAAAASLGESGSPAVLPALIRCFDDDSGRVAAAAARSASAFGAAAVPLLIEALADRRPAHLYWASQALTFIGRPAVEPLIEALGGPDPQVARYSAKLLGDLGDPRALAPLRERRERGGDPELLFAVNTALRRLGEATAEGS